MLKGSATSEGTAAYRAAQGAGAADGHFREWRGLSLSSLGLGTYLGHDDDATDALYEAAVERAIVSGINVVDSAVNYRGQRSERAVGRALGRLVSAGGAAREGVVVATKGGFLPFDGPAPPGLLRPGDLVAGCHCMTPRYLEDQIERSRVNLGLETIDIYYLHNPETQLGEVSRPAPWLASVKASGMARLYGSWTTRKLCSGPPTSSASATRSGSERKSRAARGWR